MTAAPPRLTLLTRAEIMATANAQFQAFWRRFHIVEELMTPFTIATAIGPIFFLCARHYFYIYIRFVFTPVMAFAGTLTDYMTTALAISFQTKPIAV